MAEPRVAAPKPLFRDTLNLSIEDILDLKSLEDGIAYLKGLANELQTWVGEPAVEFTWGWHDDMNGSSSENGGSIEYCGDHQSGPDLLIFTAWTKDPEVAKRLGFLPADDGDRWDYGEEEEDDE